MKPIKYQMAGGCVDALILAFFELLVGICFLQTQEYLIASIVIACSLFNTANAISRYNLYKGL